MIKRFSALTVVILPCLALGACTSFSGAVADHWPTWAGGMPKDVPPRPGAPGYEEFLAHQQGKDASASAATGTTAAAPAAAAAPGADNTGVPAIPTANRQPGDQSAVQGGLY